MSIIQWIVWALYQCAKTRNILFSHLLIFRRGRNIGSVGSGMLARMAVSVVSMFCAEWWSAHMMAHVTSCLGSDLDWRVLLRALTGSTATHRPAPGHCTAVHLLLSLYIVLSCTLVTAYKLPAPTTESRSSFSVWIWTFCFFLWPS